MSRLRKKVFFFYCKTLLLLVGAFVAGMVIAKTTASVWDKKEFYLEQPIDVALQEVFILKQDISKGKELSPSDFVVVKQPEKNVPQGAICLFEQISGRILNQAIKKGAILVEGYFVPISNESEISEYIPLGYQSVPIHISRSDIENNSEIQHIFQGDKVDIIAISPAKDGENTQNEKTVFENISVLKTNWANKDISLLSEKASLSLLLSNEQKQDLIRLTDNDIKIRIRICPILKSVHNEIVSSFESEIPQPVVASSVNSVATAPQSAFSRYDARESGISFSFKKNDDVKKASPNSIDTTRTIPESLNKPKSLDNKPAMDNQSPSQTLASSAKYISFYDTINNSYAPSQWQVVNPRQPIVYEGQQEKTQLSSSNPSLKPRGVYYQQGQYITVE
ncbi:MAG: SAF domain-containing protein [Planctomycetaceae bacterium]|jgi:Flp pilus assembly protein CpaB|nr:SAF domain-containing protein [Planctomycetaceae bacterium]